MSPLLHAVLPCARLRACLLLCPERLSVALSLSKGTGPLRQALVPRFDKRRPELVEGLSAHTKGAQIIIDSLPLQRDAVNGMRTIVRYTNTRQQSASEADLHHMREGRQAMSWNAMTYEGKDTVLRVVRDQADGFFKLAEVPETWTAKTACPEWEVRDLVGHIVDTTETYFEGFDAARSDTEVEPAYGLPGMAKRAEEQGKSFRDLPQKEMVDKLRTDFDKMMGIFESLTPDDWTGLMVPHFYMGPVPAFFYPAFQLMDYGVHSWDIREGTGREHGLHSDVADLLVPFMFGIWAGTMREATDVEPFNIGVRVLSGPNAGDNRISVSSDGMSYEQGEVSDLPAVIEFDPGSFVLTAFGRFNGGTVRGDKALADRFLGMFFRI
jgi:uncharacterized protein (TIGR03083 family)